MPNAARAYKVLDHIHAHPGSHDQGQFLEIAGLSIRYDEDAPYLDAGEVATSCGTTACFAGWSALLAGHRLNRYATAENGRHAQAIAMRWLEIDDEQAELLFFEAQDMETLVATIHDVFGPRPAAADAV